MRLKGAYQLSNATWTPYISANVLHSLGENDQIHFIKSAKLEARTNSVMGQIGAGITGGWSENRGVYASIVYTTNLDSVTRKTIGGYVGVRLSW